MSKMTCAECGSTDQLEEDCGDGKLYCNPCHDDFETKARAPTAASDEVECEICFDTVPVSATLPLCKARHRYCAECCWRCCQSSLGDGLVPACPSDKEHRCGAIGKGVAERALSRWLGEKGQTQARKAELGAAWAVRGSIASGFTSGKLDAVYASAERAAQGAVQCPGRNNKCKAWYIPAVPHSTRPQRVVCAVDKCGTSFCSLCRHPYHFRTDCAEALRIQARWVKFLQDDLAPFLMAAIKVDPGRYSDALKEHTKAKSALDDATKDALTRFDELKKMELWKEKHCKRCPKCKRVVEKMSGCDMMKCGNDAHGGNQQRGCGKAFVWTAGQPNSALPYTADLRRAAAEDGAADDAEAESAHGRERRLQRDASESHVLMPGTPLPCDGCGNDLVGPRWQCIQCEGAVDLCIACVGRVAQGRVLELRDGRKHPKGHVFRRVRHVAVGATALDVDDPESLLAGQALQRLAGAAPARRGGKRRMGAEPLEVGLCDDDDGDGDGGGGGGGGGLEGAPSRRQRSGAGSVIDLDSDVEEENGMLQSALRASARAAVGGSTSSAAAGSSSSHMQRQTATTPAVRTERSIDITRDDAEVRRGPHQGPVPPPPPSGAAAGRAAGKARMPPTVIACD